VAALESFRAFIDAACNGSANIHVAVARLHVFSLTSWKGFEFMKLGNLLNFSAGLIAGAILLGASAQAAPVPPISAQAATVTAPANVEPAVVSQNEVDQVKPVQVHWHHRHWHHRGWHHRHWHHRHWHHRHWRHHHRHW